MVKNSGENLSLRFLCLVHPSVYDGFQHHPRWLGMGFLNHQQYHMMGSLSGASRGLPKGLNSLCWGWSSHL